MTKFEVGDQVEVVKDNYYGVKIGEVLEVIEVDKEDPVRPYLLKNARTTTWAAEEHLELVTAEQTKNLRITALEKKIEEMEGNSFHDLERITEIERCLESLEQKAECIEEGIKAIEKQIEHLEQEINQRLEVPVEPSTTVEGKPKTPNQQRREIIEKAKQFVEKHGEGFLFDSAENSICAAKLEKIQDSVGYESCIGYSQCHPFDVFNEHIGKAIALGRALGLDVSEFEQAVQPTEAVVGMIAQDYYRFREDFVYEIDGRSNIKHINAKLEYYRKGTCNGEGFNTRILNDTNAQYGGETI